ncbi:MAG: hypothetical protein AAGJ34_04565 [Pseudomonadota bacterium]
MPRRVDATRCHLPSDRRLKNYGQIAEYAFQFPHNDHQNLAMKYPKSGQVSAWFEALWQLISINQWGAFYNESRTRFC